MAEEMQTVTFVVSAGPKHYRLRRTFSGGIELLGGYECTRYVAGEPREMSVEWRPMPTLNPDELPEDL